VTAYVKLKIYYYNFIIVTVIVKLFLCVLFSVQLYKDLLHPSVDEEKRRCKLKRLVQSPNSYFMDVKCPGGCSSSTICVIIQCFRKLKHGVRSLLKP